MFSSGVARGRSTRRGAIRGQRSRGQVIILFALMGLVIIGMAGLALDGGLSYMNKSTLQSAGDNASLAGARMLAIDWDCYNGYVPSGTTTNCGSSIAPDGFVYLQAQVGSVISSYSSGTLAISSVAYLLDSSDNPFCWLYKSAGALANPSAACTDPANASPSQQLDYACVGSDCTPASGVRVESTETHATSLMRLLGVAQASETTTASAIFQPGNSGFPPFAVFYSDCGLTMPLGVGDPVTYHSPKWKKAFGCAQIGGSDNDAQFKGCLRNTGTITVPGWIASQSGGGCSFSPVTTNTTITVPLIDCIQHGAPCSDAGLTGFTPGPNSPDPCYPPGTTPPTYCVDGFQPPYCAQPNAHDVPPYPASAPTSGWDIMCAFTWVKITATNNCLSNGDVCEGTVSGFADNSSPEAPAKVGAVVQLAD
jgi:hypothetical protein